MASNYSFQYCVDIVMCIDATGSMGPLLDTVKAHALTFYQDIENKMKQKGKTVHEVRVRVIVFRDYLADGKDAMLASKFFMLPNESEELETFVGKIQPFGGGDDPEDGLEALAYAIASDWTKSGHKRRHIIVVWTDEGTHPIGFGRDPENGRGLAKMCGITWEQVQINSRCYPPKMAKDFAELTNWWGDEISPGLMENNAKRLILFAPLKPYWSNITDNWNFVIHHPAEAEKGLREFEYQEILDTIASTLD